MERSFQDLDLSQIKVGAESRFPPEGGEANPDSADAAAGADDTASASDAASANDVASAIASPSTNGTAPATAVAASEPVAQPRPANHVAAANNSDSGTGYVDPDASHHLEEGVLKVSSHSRHSAVAGAIAGVLRHDTKAEVQAIGAAACYQAIKAVATARSYLLPEGIDISCVPLFTDVSIGEHERTAIRFIVTRHMVETPNQ